MTSTLEEQFTKGLEGIIAGKTSICTINPENESLLYRGYVAPELAEAVNFEEVIHLLLEGRLPKKREVKRVTRILIQERKLDKRLLKVLKLIPPTSSGMDVLRTATSFLGNIAENKVHDYEETKTIAYSLIGKLPFVLMSWYHLSRGEAVPKISRDISHAGRILQLINGRVPDAIEEKIMNASLILYAEHEYNASTFSAKVATSTMSGIYSAVAAAIGTLKGPLHGGATERAIDLILSYKTVQEAEQGTLQMLSDKKKIMGFGHRVYKKGDSRSYIMKTYARELAAKKGKQQYYEIAEKIEKTVREQKGIFPNVDFYTALTYYILDIPKELYTPLFVLSRLSGWSAHILEQMSDNRLIRPRAIYVGHPQRDISDKR